MMRLTYLPMMATTLTACAAAHLVTLPDTQTAIPACGTYQFESGDRLMLEGHGRDFLLVRDDRTRDFLLSGREGRPLRLLVDPIADACEDVRSNEAACIQGRRNSVVILRELRDGENC
jgi:hypothetical protein